MVMQQGSVLSPLLFAVVVDIVTELAEGVLTSQFLYAGDLVPMSETIEGLRNKFIKWKEAFEIRCLCVNLEKTKVVVSAGVTKDGLSNSKVDLCEARIMRVKAISVLCVQCGKCVHGRFVRMKRDDRFTVFMKVCWQEMWREYLRSSGAGRKVK